MKGAIVGSPRKCNGEDQRYLPPRASLPGRHEAILRASRYGALVRTREEKSEEVAAASSSERLSARHLQRRMRPEALPPRLLKGDGQIVQAPTPASPGRRAAALVVPRAPRAVRCGPVRRSSSSRFRIPYYRSTGGLPSGTRSSSYQWQPFVPLLALMLFPVELTHNLTVCPGLRHFRT